VLLVGLAGLFNVTHDRRTLELGDSIITAVTERLVTSAGILNEPTTNPLGEDGEQFKGIFMRYSLFYFALIIVLFGDSIRSLCVLSGLFSDI
jgi:predicted alpha-1,6-mannanase (GH76 family)